MLAFPQCYPFLMDFYDSRQQDHHLQFFLSVESIKTLNKTMHNEDPQKLGAIKSTLVHTSNKFVIGGNTFDAAITNQIESLAKIVATLCDSIVIG